MGSAPPVALTWLSSSSIKVRVLMFALLVFMGTMEMNPMQSLNSWIRSAARRGDDMDVTGKGFSHRKHLDDDDYPELRAPAGGFASSAAARMAAWGEGAKGHPSPPLDDIRSSAVCEGDDILNRVCFLSNVCHDRGGAWTLFAADGERCVRSSSGSGSGSGSNGPGESTVVCHNDPLVFIGSLRYNWGILSPAVIGVPAPPPGTADVKWHEGPAILQTRHFPDNTAHCVTDDVYPVFWALRRKIAHPAYCGEGAGEDGVGGNSDKEKGPPVIVVWQDGWNADAPLTSKYFSLYHHLAGATVDRLHDGAWLVDGTGGAVGSSGSFSTVCFRKVYVGTPGVSLHRNAGYQNAAMREWPNPIDRETRAADRRAFARFVTLRALRSGGVNVDKYVPPHRDKVVLINRLGARQITNVDATVQALEGILHATGLPLTSEVVQVEKLSMGDLAILFQRTALLIAVHGAGLTNLDLLQPGTSIIELTMVPEVAGQGVFRSWSELSGMKYSPCPLRPDGQGIKNPVLVDVGEFQQVLDIVLQTQVGPLIGVNAARTHQRPI